MKKAIATGVLALMALTGCAPGETTPAESAAATYAPFAIDASPEPAAEFNGSSKESSKKQIQRLVEEVLNKSNELDASTATLDAYSYIFGFDAMTEENKKTMHDGFGESTQKLVADYKGVLSLLHATDITDDSKILGISTEILEGELGKGGIIAILNMLYGQSVHTLAITEEEGKAPAQYKKIKWEIPLDAITVKGETATVDYRKAKLTLDGKTKTKFPMLKESPYSVGHLIKTDTGWKIDVDATHTKIVERMNDTVAEDAKAEAK